jgi:multisubunit Na+/H+ antiporter MnhG subunit
MGMLMLSLLGTWAYTIKTALDASGISEISSFWLTALTVLITAPIYYYLILKSGRKDSMASNHANSADAKSRAAD